MSAEEADPTGAFAAREIVSTRVVGAARAVACLLAVREFGLGPPAVAHLLNVSPTVSREGVVRV